MERPFYPSRLFPALLLELGTSSRIKNFIYVFLSPKPWEFLKFLPLGYSWCSKGLLLARATSQIVPIRRDNSSKTGWSHSCIQLLQELFIMINLFIMQCCFLSPNPGAICHLSVRLSAHTQLIFLSKFEPLKGGLALRAPYIDSTRSTCNSLGTRP